MDKIRTNQREKPPPNPTTSVLVPEDNESAVMSLLRSDRQLGTQPEPDHNENPLEHINPTKYRTDTRSKETEENRENCDSKE
ncbi:hypothetical protein M5689_003404 [Euphorbia peplus]|nr:hypothetical protein M5689_003404 [Euphorbia peplus]